MGRVSDKMMSGLPVIQEKDNALLKNTHLFLKLFVIFKHVLFDDKLTTNTRQTARLFIFYSSAFTDNAPLISKAEGNDYVATILTSLAMVFSFVPATVAPPARACLNNWRLSL